MTSKSSLIRTIENQRRQFFRMEQANKELKAQLEQQAKSIDELQKLVEDAADYLDINSQTVISNSSILHREFRSLATKYKTNKQGK